MARVRIRRPFKRRHIADAIINEWIEAVRVGRPYSEANIQAAIAPIIDTEGGTRRVTISLDKYDSGTGVRTLNVAVPLPEPETGQSIEDWIRSKWSTDEQLDEFGNYTLYGCGR
jgi:hypothetical protein